MIIYIHGVGKKFNLDEFLQARAQSILAVKKVSSYVEVGMTEDDGIDLIERTLREFGVEKYWHPSKFRIDQNTTLNFRDESDKTAVISKESIYFIDIGPVFGIYEGDYGETFSLTEKKHIKSKSRRLRIFLIRLLSIGRIMTVVDQNFINFQVSKLKV